MQSKTIDFSKFSSIKIGPTVEVKVVEQGDEFPKGYFLVGGANNLLVSPTPPPIMVLGKSFDFIEIKDGSLYVGCATKTGRLLSFAKKHNIANLEFIAKLPGTIGGMVAMNAGVKEYEIFNILEAVKIDGKWIDAQKIEHGYRFAKLGGIATEVKIKLEYGYSEELKEELLKLRNNQPKEPSAGSAFKNPEGDFAGRLIQEVGLKGHRVGDMAFSQVHANFLVNLGDGTFEQAKELLDLAKSRVKEKFGIELQEEVKIIDASYEGEIVSTRDFINYLYRIGFTKSFYLNNKELIEFFEDAGIFRLKGYIKELKFYKQKNIDSIIFYYLFDRHLATSLFKIGDTIEAKLKSILVQKYYNATKNHFAYLIKDNHKFNNFIFDVPTINNWRSSDIDKNEKERYNHYIKFYKKNYNFLANRKKYLKKRVLLDSISNNINYPPFKYLIESATLGLTITLILSLEINKHDMLKLIAKEFGISNPNHFKHYLFRFKELRNRVSHLNRVFNRTYRSVRGVGKFKILRKEINNHKILDMYLFLVFLLNNLKNINSYRDFENIYIKELIDNLKSENYYNKSIKKLIENLSEKDFKQIIQIMES